MVKFTVSLNDKFISSLIFDKSNIHIGHNSSNDIIIDHPAAAPIHAIVKQEGYAYIVTQLNTNYPLNINNDEIKETRLINNDKIFIGNYTLTFNSARLITPTGNKKVSIVNAIAVNETINLPNASIQVLSGKNIGRVIPIKDESVNIGSDDSDIAIISKQKKGYTIITKETDVKITINYEPIDNDNSIILNDNDMLVVDNISMQFFLES